MAVLSLVFMMGINLVGQGKLMQARSGYSRGLEWEGGGADGFVGFLRRRGSGTAITLYARTCSSTVRISPMQENAKVGTEGMEMRLKQCDRTSRY